MTLGGENGTEGGLTLDWRRRAREAYERLLRAIRLGLAGLTRLGRFVAQQAPDREAYERLQRNLRLGLRKALDRLQALLVLVRTFLGRTSHAVARHSPDREALRRHISSAGELLRASTRALDRLRRPTRQDGPQNGHAARHLTGTVVAWVAVAATLAACAAAGLIAVSLGASSGAGAVSAKTSRLQSADSPAAPAMGLAVPHPSPLSRAGSVAWWSPVLRSVAARSRPSKDAPVVSYLSRDTPEGTSNLVLVLTQAADRRGTLWVRTRLAVLPANTTGWVPRKALGGFTLVRTRLVVDRKRLTATLFAAGRRVFRAPIGVGKPDSPTPTGEFYIRNKLTSLASPFYGPVAFGTSARSAGLTDWASRGFIGIHGTDRPEVLPGRVSRGSIRMRNEDILQLARLMPVGTPLTIV